MINGQAARFCTSQLGLDGGRIRKLTWNFGRVDPKPLRSVNSEKALTLGAALR
jgi:hypothetical protein